MHRPFSVHPQHGRHLRCCRCRQSSRKRALGMHRTGHWSPARFRFPATFHRRDWIYRPSAASSPPPFPYRKNLRFFLFPWGRFSSTCRCRTGRNHLPDGSFLHHCIASAARAGYPLPTLLPAGYRERPSLPYRSIRTVAAIKKGENNVSVWTSFKKKGGE